MAMFIRIDANNDVIKKTEGTAKKLTEVCPVKIFKAGAQAGTVDIVEDNVDAANTLSEVLGFEGPEGIAAGRKLSRRTSCFATLGFQDRRLRPGTSVARKS